MSLSISEKVRAHERELLIEYIEQRLYMLRVNQLACNTCCEEELHNLQDRLEAINRPYREQIK